MDISDKIRMAATFARISEAELARRVNDISGGKLGKTSQSFGQRLKTGKFTTEEREQIAEALGAKHIEFFEFPDGTKI